MQKNDNNQDDFSKLSDSMQKSQLSFASLFANMAEGVALHEIVTDSNGTPENYRIVDVNPSFEKLLTLSRDSVVGKLATEAYGTAVPPFFSDYVTVAQERKPLALSVYFGPMQKHFEISAVPWGENGFATIFFDITERKVAEAAIFASEERLRRAIKFAPSPLAIFTESGEMLQISDSWTKITGYTHAEIPTVGDWARMAYPEIPVARKETILSIFDSSVPLFHPEVSVITKQGETRTWSITAVPLGKLSDGQRAALTMAIDITESKRMETERLESLKKAALMERMVSLGTLAAGVAHEINQPLQALKVTADAMNYTYSQGKSLDAEQTIENTKRIAAQADRIAKIVRRMRDFVIQSQNSSMTGLDLRDAVHDGLDMVRQRLKSHNIELVEKMEDKQRVLGDKSRLEEVVINIVVNAMQAMEETSQQDKQIVVHTWDEGSQVILEISNNGPLIPQEVINRIFDPFFTSKISGENMGLGMSIVFSIVSSHGGAIHVRNLDSGVVFRIELPAIS